MYYIPTQPYISVIIDKIYTIHYFEYHKDYTFSGESHDFWELLYIDNGELITGYKGTEFVLKQNQLTFYAPGEFHSLKANKIVAPNTIVVSFSCSNPDLKKLAGRIFHVNEYERSLLAAIIREAGKAYKNDLSDPAYKKLKKKQRTVAGTTEYAAEQLITCFLQILLIEFLRNGGYTPKKYSPDTATDNKSKEKFNSLIEWIDRNINLRFCISDLCAEAMVSKSVLEQLFRENTGMSAIEYCRIRKIKIAKKLLREENLNVSEISELLGFSSVHYFSRTFKEIENIAPSDYAKSVKSIVDHMQN